MPKKADLLKRIVVDRRVLAGKPVIKGTRVPVDGIIQRIAEGQSFDEILEDCPNLKKDDIRAALEYAACLVRAEDIIPKTMRYRHRIGRKALVVDTEEGMLLRPIPDPSMEKGSLKALFKGRSSNRIMSQVRREELLRERRLNR